MKAREGMGIKPTIDVRHHIDHHGLAAQLGYAFVVKGNEDGDGGDGEGGAGDGSDSGAGGEAGAAAEGGDAASSADAAAADAAAAAGAEEGGGGFGTDYGADPDTGFDTAESVASEQNYGSAAAAEFGTDAPAAADETGGAGFDDMLLATTITPTSEFVASDDNRTRDFAVREQKVRQAAFAGSITRSDNEADLLGYTRPVRRRSSRSMLGG